ncbi:MAG: 5-bromo-4-chloroindolyl phosphate hydrolysis family protein [Eubacteriales bacterium]|nr:5-bromo-4-chloroindolyl phosphate hydrolysis family protein [Eubacteriales bacterium]
MKHRRNKKPSGTAPIYAFAGAWLVFALSFPLYRLWQLILCSAASLFTALIVYLLLKSQAAKYEPVPEDEAKEEKKVSQKPEKSYGPEVDAVIAEGKIAQKEMGRLYSSIQNPDVRRRINELMAISDKIVRDAIDDPSDVPQIRKFLDYYLPTTIKLLNAYDRMSAQDIEGENISGSMQRIEDMLDTAIAAYKKQLDSLFANQALDIETDIEVMNGMLAREGLGGKSYLDMKDFMKNATAQGDGPVQARPS